MIPFPHITGTVPDLHELERSRLHLAEDIQSLESIEIPVQDTFLIDIIGRDIIADGIGASRYAQVMLLRRGQILEEDIVIVNVVIALRICSPPLSAFDRDRIIRNLAIHIVPDSLKPFRTYVIPVAIIVGCLIEIKSP